MEWNRKTVRSLMGLIAFAIGLFVALSNLGAVFAAFKAVLGMGSFLIVGFSIAFILAAPMRFIETRLLAPLLRLLGGRFERLRRPLGLGITLLFVLGVALFVVFMIIPELAATLALLGEQLPGFLEEATAWGQDLALRYGQSLHERNMPEVDWVKIGDAVLDLLQRGGSSLFTGTFNAATSLASGLFNFTVGLALGVFGLFQKEKLCGQARRILYAYLPEKRADRTLEVMALSQTIFRNFLSGQFLEAIILGWLCFLGMRVLGFPFAPMVSVLVGVSAFVPVFGAFIGAGVGMFMILVNQGTATALWFLLFIFVLQQLEGDLIYPHVVGKSVRLPGLWVLVAVTLFGNIAGIVGMLVGVPISSLLYALLRQAVNRRNEAGDVDLEKLKPRADR